MYYGKYDYYILVEASNEVEAITGTYNAIGTYNITIPYGVSRRKNYLYKDTNIRKSYESLDNDIFNKEMKEIVIKYCGAVQCKKKLINGEIKKTISEISISSSLDEYISGIASPTYTLYINDKKATFTIVFDDFGITTIKDITGDFTLKEFGNSYTFYVTKDSPIIINGYNSDSFTKNTQFFNMESLEGSFEWKREHETIEIKEDVYNKQKKIKHKKYTINIQEPEHDSSLLDIFKKNDIIKIIKLYPDRVEEFFNCSLVNSIVVSEESDVNKINFEIASTNLYIKYFNESGDVIGGELID